MLYKCSLLLLHLFKHCRTVVKYLYSLHKQFKNNSSEMLAPNKELILKATKADWAYVRAMTGLAHAQIWQYKTGRVKKHLVQIEEALLKSIEIREKAAAKHTAKIHNTLEKLEEANNETLAANTIAKTLTNKYK